MMFDSLDAWRGSAVFVSGQSFAPAGRRQRGRALGSQLLSQSLEQSGSHGAATTFSALKGSAPKICATPCSLNFAYRTRLQGNAIAVNK